MLRKLIFSFYLANSRIIQAVNVAELQEFFSIEKLFQLHSLRLLYQEWEKSISLVGEEWEKSMNKPSRRRMKEKYKPSRRRMRVNYKNE